MEEIYAEIVFELLKIAYVVILMYPIVQGSLLLLVAACDVCAWVCKALGGLVDMGLNRAQRVRPSTLGSRNDSSSSSSNNNNNNNEVDIEAKLRDAEVRGAQLMRKYIDAEAKASAMREELARMQAALDAAETLIGMLSSKNGTGKTSDGCGLFDNNENGLVNQANGVDMPALGTLDHVCVTQTASSTGMQAYTRGDEQVRKSKFEKIVSALAFVLVLMFSGFLLLLMTSGGIFGRILNVCRRKNRAAVDTVRALFCKSYALVLEAGCTVYGVMCATIRRLSVALWPLTWLVQNPDVPRRLNALLERTESIAWLHRVQSRELARQNAEHEELAAELQGVISWNARFCPSSWRTKRALLDAAHHAWILKTSVDAEMNSMKERWTLREQRVATVFDEERDEYNRLQSEVLALRSEADAVEVELELAKREARGLEDSLERSTISRKNQIVRVVHLMHVLLSIGSTVPSSWRDSTTTLTLGLAKMTQLFYQEVRATCWRALGICPGLQVFPRSATAPLSRAATTMLNGVIDFGHYKLGISVSFAFPAVFVGNAPLSRALFLVEPHLYDWVRGIVHPSSGPLTRTSAFGVDSGSMCLSVVAQGPSTPSVASMPASPMDWSPTRSPGQTTIPFTLTCERIEDQGTKESGEQPRLESEDLTLGGYLREILCAWAYNVRVAKVKRKLLDDAICANQAEFAESVTTRRETLCAWAYNVRVAKVKRKLLDDAIRANQAEFAESVTTRRETLCAWAYNVRVAKVKRKLLDDAIRANQAEFAESCKLSALRERQEEGRLQVIAQCFADVRRLRRSLAAWRFALFSSAMSEASDDMPCASGISSRVSTPPAPRAGTFEAVASTSASPPSASSSSSRPSSSSSSSPPSSQIENAAASKKKHQGTIFRKGKKRITSPKFGRYALRSLDINVG